MSAPAGLLIPSPAGSDEKASNIAQLCFLRVRVWDAWHVGMDAQACSGLQPDTTPGSLSEMHAITQEPRLNQSGPSESIKIQFIMCDVCFITGASSEGRCCSSAGNSLENRDLTKSEWDSEQGDPRGCSGGAVTTRTNLLFTFKQRNPLEWPLSALDEIVWQPFCKELHGSLYIVLHHVN